MEESNVVYRAGLHWILFLAPFAFFCFSAYAGLSFPAFQKVALLFVAFAAIWLAMTWVNYQFSSLTIKKKQVILRTGMLVRKTTDIPLAKIETIDISQSVSGSMFHYGTLLITGTGGTRHVINYLDKPLTCRRYIEQLMHD